MATIEVSKLRRVGRGLVLAASLSASGFAAAQASPPALLTNARIETASGADLVATLKSLPRVGDPLWVGWAVPMVPGQGQVCCYENGRARGCRLERTNSGISMMNRQDRLAAEELLVLVRFDGAKPTDIRSADSGCALDAGGRRVIWLEDVTAPASAGFLAGLATGEAGRKDDVGDEALTSLALHAGSEADAALARMAGPPTPTELREQAIFWLGNARGRFGYQALSRLVRLESDSDLLEKIAFAFSQSPIAEAHGALVELAERHQHPEVRSQALFWLAQRGGDGVAEIIVHAAEHDRSEEVREQAVFALSQLEDGQGVVHLLRLCKAGSLQARKHALFWLGQSDDPRAMAALEDLLLRRR